MHGDLAVDWCSTVLCAGRDNNEDISDYCINLTEATLCASQYCLYTCQN